MWYIEWDERYLDVEPGRVLADCPLSLRWENQVDSDDRPLTPLGHQVASIPNFFFSKNIGAIAASLEPMHRLAPLPPSQIIWASCWRPSGTWQHNKCGFNFQALPRFEPFLWSIYSVFKLWQCCIYSGSLAVVGRPFWWILLGNWNAFKCNAELREKSQGWD